MHWGPPPEIENALQCAERPTIGEREYETVREGCTTAGALGAAFLLGQSTSNFDKWWTPENDAHAAAPQHHKVLFENDEVSVLEATVPPGVRESLHAHRYPSVLYYISAAHLKEYSPGVPAVDRGQKDDGGVIFLPVGPPHQMENLENSKPLRAIRVELKKAR